MSTNNNESGNIRFLLLICLVAALGGFLFGFDTGVVSGTTASVETQYTLTPETKGWFVASALWGCVLGALLAGPFADRFGRKPVLISAAILFFVSAVGCGFPVNYAFLVFARFVGGLGVGVASMIAPLYISEVSPAKHRGRLVTIFQFAIVVGISISYYSNVTVLTISTDYAEFAQKIGLEQILVKQNWRGMFLAETIPALLFFVSIFFIPESPRFLTKIGKLKLASDIMEKIHGKLAAEKEVVEIKNSLHEETGKLSELFGKYRFGLIIAVLLMFFSQFTGINVIMYYGPEVYKAAGFSETFSFRIQTIVGTANIIFTVIALWKVDSLGRKPLMIIGTTCVFTILTIVAVLFALQGVINPKMIQICMPIFVILFVAAFAMSWGPIPWIIVSEIFPNRIRGRAASISTMMIWISCIIVAQTFPVWSEKYGPAYCFAIYAAFMLPALVFILFFLPETKQRSLEELEIMLYEKSDKKT